MKGMIPRPPVVMEPGDSDVAQEALTAAGRAQATADNARAMVLNRDPRLQTLEQETVTLAGLAAEYSAQLSASLDDRRQLHAGLDELETQIQQAELRFATDLYDEQQTRAAGLAALQATLSGLSSRLIGIEGRSIQIEYRDGVPVPPAVVLLGSQTVDVALTWPTAFPDTNYVIVKPQVEVNAVALLGRVDAVLKSKTASGCVVTVTTTATVSAGSATLAVLAYRRG